MRPGYNVWRHGNWNVTGQSRPKSCRCLILAALLRPRPGVIVSSPELICCSGSWGFEPKWDFESEARYRTRPVHAELVCWTLEVLLD